MPFPLRVLVAWAVDAAALAVAAWIFSGISVGGSAGTLILAALVYGLLATFVKPALKLLTFPLAIVTLGVAWFFVVLVALIVANTRSAKISWVVGSSHVSLIWIIIVAAVLGWLSGLVTGLLFHRRTRRRA